MENKIIEIVKNYFGDKDVVSVLDQRIEDGDYIDDDWQDEYDSEHDWYAEYGNGECENEIHGEILKEIAKQIDESPHSWYFNNKYCDIDKLIYKYYPQLETT